jgi:exodeoxyribonuclease VII small subunit
MAEAGTRFADMPAKKPEPSFEQALARLESLVESMESGDIALAELVDKFTEGTRLVQQCEARLKEAELKIEQLQRSRDGIVAEPFAAASDPDA